MFILAVRHGIEISYIICHGSLCHNMNICHDMRCYFAKSMIQTQNFDISIQFCLTKCAYR